MSEQSKTWKNVEYNPVTLMGGISLFLPTVSFSLVSVLVVLRA